MKLLSHFQPAAINEAAQVAYERAIANGGVDALTADLFAALGSPLVMQGKKGASPAGAAMRYALLCRGDKPQGKPAPGIVAGDKWESAMQALHGLVSDLVRVGALAGPVAPMPAWADPATLKAAAEARKAKVAETRTKNKAAPATAPTVAAAVNAPQDPPTVDMGAADIQVAYRTVLAALADPGGPLTAAQVAALSAACAARTRAQAPV